MEKFKSSIRDILSTADIRIDGTRPWDIQIINDSLYRRLYTEGSLGLGESYMDGWWECEQLDEFFTRIFRNDSLPNIFKQLGFEFKIKIAMHALHALIFNHGKSIKAGEIARKHYDISNNLYQCMLDQRMVYTCGYWENAYDLDRAQEAKLELVCNKVGLKPGDKVLDIGCGWGSFAKYASERYDVSVTGITVSTQQAELARQICDGLPIEIRLQDYRNVNEKFDHIVSLGMFEHVCYKNYRTYMEVVARNLRKDGTFLLQTIGRDESTITTDPWISKYIFPNSMLPSIRQIGSAVEGLFVMEDWHNFGADYDKTLMAWYQNFNDNWPKIAANYDRKFFRMWRYYLLLCAGLFRARYNQLWQIVLSPNGFVPGYRSLR